MTEGVPSDALLRKLSEVFRRVAYDGDDRRSIAELFELTKSREYPELLNELSEAFGMMMVKVEARELHLEQIIGELKKSRAEVEAYSHTLEARVRERTSALQQTNEALSREIRQRKRAERDLQKANRVLRQLADLDGLTLAANRRRFDEVLLREWRRMQRQQKCLSLILADIDHFKGYNDAYGHLQGDECLRRVAGALRAEVKRPGDLVARYGGEEFAVLLPATTVEGAVRVAEAIREGVRMLEIPHERSPVAPCVTLSLGAAGVIPRADSNDPAVLVARADAVLYEAKRRGRNRFCADGRDP